MKTILSLFLMMAAGTAHAAVVDTFVCMVIGTGVVPLSANATLAIPREPMTPVEANYQSAQGMGFLTAFGTSPHDGEINVNLGLTITYLMQTDSSGKLIRAGESVCLSPSLSMDGASTATYCAEGSSGNDPFDGYTAMPIKNGVAYFVPTGALNFAMDLHPYGHVALSCSFQGTLE